MTYKYILFDLDGTISASGPGIIKAMQYGLTAAGINETDPAALKSFIGPPLNVQIQKIYGLSEKDTLAVIMKFREQYDNKGIFDSAPYEGINELLFINNIFAAHTPFHIQKIKGLRQVKNQK